MKLPKGKGEMMKEYTVAYIKDGEAYAYDNFIEGATISDIVKELTYDANRYGVDYDEIAIFEMNSDESTVYYEVVTKDGKYELVEEV